MIDQKLKWPVGYPAAPVSYGLFFDGTPKATRSQCKNYNGSSCNFAENVKPIKQQSAACSFFEKKKAVKAGPKMKGDTEQHEKPAYRTKECGIDRLI